MTKWQVLDLIGFEGFIESDRGALVIQGSRVPVADLAVVLLGQGASFGFGLIDKAVRYDFAVLICDWRSVPIAYLGSWSENTRVVARHRAQASLTEPRRKNAWKQLVRSKVLNQAEVLDWAGAQEASALERMVKQVKSGDPANVEGHAAQVYWAGLFGSEFRRHRDNGDFVNSALNYGYTLLRGTVIREMLAAGLSPSLGVFHRHRSNTFALADDLIEPFRPLVDACVKGLVAGNTELTREVKAALAAVLRETYGAEGQTVATAVREACQAYAQYVEGDVARFKPPSWKR